MTDSFLPTTILEWSALLVAAVGFVSTILGGLSVMLRRSESTFDEKIVTLHTKLDAVTDCMMDVKDTTRETGERVRTLEVTINNGLTDRTTRTEQAVTDIHEKQASIMETLAALKAAT